MSRACLQEERGRGLCGLDQLSRRPKLNRFQSLRKPPPVPIIFDHRRWAICQKVMFMYSGKHPEVNLLPRQPSLSFFFSLPLPLSPQYLKHPEIFVQCATDLMSLKTLFQKKTEEAHEEDKSKVFWPIPLLPGTGNTGKVAREDNKTKRKLNGKKGRPRYALAVSQIVFVVPPGNPVKRKMPGRARNSLMLVSKSANAPPQG